VATLVADKLKRQCFERFTVVLETNGIRQLERKQGWNVSTIILQILAAKQTSEWESPATIKDMSIHSHDNFDMQL